MPDDVIYKKNYYLVTRSIKRLLFNDGSVFKKSSP